MPRYRIRIVNSDFDADEEQDYPDLDAAKYAAMKGALEIGTDQVLLGESFYGAEVRVEERDVLRARFMVSLGSTPLSNA